MKNDFNPCPKVVKIRKKTSLGIPKEVVKTVIKRDNHTCQYCGYQGEGTELHHIILAKRGRKVHTKENIITLCGQFTPNQCHKKMHEGAKDTTKGWISQKVYQEWAVNWSRKRYGNIIDLIKAKGLNWNK